MLMESVFLEAQPHLIGRKIKDAVIGISLIAVELDNGYVGVSYVLREGLKAGCSIFPYGQQVIGQNALNIAEFALTGRDDLQRAIGMAVLGAASQGQDLKDSETEERPFGVEVRDTDIVGMVGFIRPVAKMIEKRSKKLYIFDKGVNERGGETDDVLNMSEQPDILPKCDIVILSGTTFINGTLEGLLKMSSIAREIIMIGASTPMFPRAFSGTNITVLAGSWWKYQHKKEIFKKISLACGITELREYSIKKSVKITL